MQLKNEFNLSREKLEEKLKTSKDDFNKLKRIAKNVFSGPDGQLLHKAMKRYCKIDTVNFNLDPQALAYNQALLNFYNTFFAILIEEDEYDRRDDSKLG